MGDSNFEKPETFSKLFRTLARWLDIGVYSILAIVYQIFFNVSTVQIFSKETIMGFHGRVQLIIGVYMLFVLAITILRGIVNPDEFFSGGKGSTGTGAKLITRIMTSLTIFALLIPVNIPKSESEMNSFEEKISTHGVVFGLLYSLQERILYNNTLGKLILGHNNYSYTTDPDDSNADSSRMISLSEAANEFTNSILVTFYRPNLVPTDRRGVAITDSRYYNPMQQSACENFAATNFAKNIYNSDGTLKSMSKIPVSGLLDYIHEECKPNSRASEYASNTGLWGFSGKHIFVMVNMPIVSTAVGILLLVVFLGFTVDVSIRAIKLELLKIIAPIPVISYMDPKGSKDSAFNAWVKLLTTTYLDLFIRVASIYFVIFIIRELVHPPNGGISMLNKGFIGALSFIFIIVGLLFFAKEAPKFIKQAMGIKDDGSGSLFGGLAKIAAAGAVVGGVAGSAIASGKASYAADGENGKNHNFGRIMKNIGAGAVGGIAGTVAGARAGLNAKDHQARAAREAMMKRNATVLSSGRSGGTFFGGLGSAAGQLFTGESYYDRKFENDLKKEEENLKKDELSLKASQDNNARRKSIMDRAKSKAVESSATTGTFAGITGNYRDFHSTFEAAKSGVGLRTEYKEAGTGRVIKKDEFNALSATDQARFSEATWFEFNGQRVDMSKAQSIDMGLLDENIEDYYHQVVGGTITDASITSDMNAFVGNIEGDYKSLKGQYGSDNSANKQKSDEINRKKLEINERRQGPDAQRAKANAERFKNGK